MLPSSAIVSLFYIICLLTSTGAVSEGTVRLVQNGAASLIQAYSAGIVQIYYSNAWGNICDDFNFGSAEADVLCHQLSYTGASSYSNTGITTVYGSDSTDTAIEDVSCLYSTYRSITQCSFRTSSSSIFSLCGNSNDVIVTCYSTRIWDSPTGGDIRLTGGIYSNQGLIEVYCNGEWGTVCDDWFGITEANVACNQLGYNDYSDYDHLSITGTVFQEIWLGSLGSCFSFDTCLTDCLSCPSSGLSYCTHSEDVTLECEYDPVSTNVAARTTSTCDNTTGSLASGILAAVIISTIIGIIICILIFTVPICICVCLGVGIGSAARGSPRTTTVVAQPHTTTAVVSTQQTTAQATPPAGSCPMQQQGPPGYPQQGGNPPKQEGYPPQQGGYHPQPGGYPPQQGGYHPQQGGYPAQEKQEPPPPY